MRKLSGLFIAAAVTGVALWQLPEQSPKMLSAQQARSTSSEASSGSRSRSSAYDEAARSTLKKAQERAQKGDLTGAKRLALEASRFPVQWGPRELSPQQFLAQLEGGASSRSGGMNPSAIAGRTPTRNDGVVTAAGTQSKPQFEQVGFDDDGAAPAKAPVGATKSDKRQLVNQWLQRAEAARRSGDQAEAIRLAKVAEAMAINVPFGADEETPSQYLARIENEPAISPVANRVVSGTATKNGATGNLAKPTSLAKTPAESNPFDDEAPTTTSAAQANEPQPLYTGRLAKPAASPVIDENPFESERVDSGKRGATDQGKLKQQALNLMSAAREDMQSGKFESAYQKALMASDVDVTWNLLDERPQQLIAEIERRQRRAAEAGANLVDATPVKKTNAKPAAIDPFEDTEPAPVVAQRPTTNAAKAAVLSDFTEEPVPTPKAGASKGSISDREYANQLLTQARQQLREGAYDEARGSALKAQALGLTYKIFDDRPELVLKEVDRLSGSVTLTRGGDPTTLTNNGGSKGKPFGPGTEAQVAAGQKRAHAQKLLTDAKTAMAQGDLDRARELASEAQKYESTFELFDERPEVVLADIERLNSKATQVPGGSASRDDNPFGTQLADSAPALPDSVGATRNKPDATASAVAKQRLQQANQLTAEARQLLKQGNLAGAKAKAQAADELNATFDLFADQPSHILAEVARLERNTKNALEDDMQLVNNAFAPVEPSPGPASKTRAGQPTGQSATPTVASRNDVTDVLPVPGAEDEQPAATQTPGAYEQARNLLAQARTDLRSGRWQSAKQKAEYVRDMDLTFSPRDDRPELVLQALGDAMAQQQGLGSSVAVAEPGRFNTGNAARSAVTPAVGAFTDEGTSPIHPSGATANDLFRQGETYLRKGDRTRAYQAFLAAAQSGQKLDSFKAQRMQDYLRELAPRKNGNIQLASAQAEGGPATGEFDNARPINEAEQQDALKFDRLRAEVLNAILRADTLREKRPDEAVEVLDKAMADVENSGFDKQRVASLVSQLRRTRGSVEGLMAQKAPILELEKRNAEVKNSVAKERETQVRIRKEFAALVDDFNKLYKAHDYAQAHVVAKQARTLDPENPVAIEMELKSRFAYRNDSNDKLRDVKEGATWEALNDVERALAYGIPNDANPVKFRKDWDEFSKRRLKNSQTNLRNRSEDEKRIEDSLSKKVSLNYENESLINVVRYIKSAADINVVIDPTGLEEEGVTTNTQVSIEVDNISVKSALKLLLEPLHLGYSIEDDALKITSRVKQQGKLVAAAYPVADLVVSMRHVTDHPPSAVMPQGINSGVMSVNPATNIPRNKGMFDVQNGGLNAVGFQNGNSPEVSLNGAGQQYDFNTLVDLITSVVEPDSWSEVGGHGTIRSNETTLSLVIRQTQQVHQEIIDLLEQLRRLQDLQITIEVRLINVSDRFFERIGVDFDFDFQDTIGGPFFDGNSTGAGGQQGGQGGQQNQQGSGGPGNPLPPFGSVIGSGTQQGQQQQGQQGQQGQQNQQGQAATTSLTFQQQPRRNLVERDDWGRGTIIGLQDSNAQFTNDLDLAFRQGSFELGVPDFGGFQPNAGIQVGLAILSDIETFFFIQAAQGDERANLLFAPKVTLYNGGTATIVDATQRPFVASLQPTVGAFSVGLTPVISQISDGIQLQVSAVVSADRRFVRLGLAPQFNNLIEIQTFAFQTGAQGGGQQGQQGQQGFGGQGQGGFGGGQQGGFGGGQFGFGGIGGGPLMQAMNSSKLGRFGRGLSGSDLVSTTPNQMNPMMGFGGIGGFGGQGQGGGGQQGQGQQGQQGQQGGAGLGATTLQQPIIETISVSTVVTVPDGGTVLLGGIKRLREGRNMTGVPILNKIPYISRLFKNSGVGRETESLMLMVTPRIIIFEEEEQLLGVELD